MTDAEAQEFSKMDPVKQREILAQSAVESVTAYQLPLRQKKRDQAQSSIQQSEGEKGKPFSEAKDDSTPSQVEQVILLKDFPQTAQDVEAMIKFGFSRLQGVFLIEEVFSRDADDDEEEVAVQAMQSQTPEQEGNAENSGAEVEPKKKEKLFNLLAERAQVFEELLQINRMLKKQPLGSELRQCIVKRLKFEGPANPMDLPTPPEDGSEPPPIDEELKATQFKLYDAFATKLKALVDELAQSTQEFRRERTRAVANLVQLWPVPLDAEAEERRRTRELRDSQEKEKLAKAEEDRKAAEAAAAPKGGKKSA